MKFVELISRTFLILTLLLMSACDNLLDVNDDPTSPTQVSEDLQLSALLGIFSYNVIGNEPARTTSLWTQQTAWSGFAPTEDNYDLDESDVNNFWNFTYIQVLNNANRLDELASENNNPAYSGISKVITAWSYAILTDLWNEIPYSEALDPTNSTPAYDSQQVVYEGVLSLLDSALPELTSDTGKIPGSHDLLYGGDMDRWVKLANTLKARFHMHLTNAPGESTVERAQAALTALNSGFSDNSDDADFAYYSKTGEENPWYQFAIDGKWDTRNQLSANYVELLKDLDDPRLPIQARPAGAVDNTGVVAGFATDDPQYVGHQNGEEGSGAAGVSSIGEFYSSPDTPLTWISYAEARFIEAEATLIVSGPVAAQSAYEEAVLASMSKLGVSQGDSDDYLQGLPTLAASGNALREIITQKYIANFLNLEVYNDWRRTGYPELQPVVNDPKTPSGMIPRRYPYPASELSNNSANVTSTGLPAGFQALEGRVWWDSE